MNCIVCGSDALQKKNYDNHGGKLSVLSLKKTLLPYVDFLIPAQQVKLKRYSSKRSPFGGQVCICQQCGHGFMATPPTAKQLQAYYQNEYWGVRKRKVNKETNVGELLEFTTNPRATHQVDFVLDKMGTQAMSNVLEIGAGAAYASLLLRHRSGEPRPQLHVCEPGLQWQQHYQKQGIQRVADFFPFQTALRFDYIHTSHWLEHVDDLNATLEALSHMLSPGGHLFIEVPNTQYFYWDLAEKDEPHIHFFTPDSLALALTKHHFECLAVEACGITYRERQQGVKLTPERYGAHAQGYWVRGLFRKASVDNSQEATA